MYIGGHISKVEGYLKAVKDSIEIGANCMQVFTGSPQRLSFPLDKIDDIDFLEFEEIRNIKNF